MRSGHSRPGVALALAVTAAAGAATLHRAHATEPEALTLNQAVARALARNTTVLAAAAEVRRAEALVMQARAGSLPTLMPEATYTRLDNDRRFQGLVIAKANRVFAAAPLTVPLVVPLPWADWARAADNQRTVEMGFEEVRRNIAIAVANAYLAVLAQRRLLRVTEVARDAAAAHDEYTARQFEAGRVSKLDNVRAKQQLHVAAAQVETARVALVRAREALGVLVAGDRPIDAASDPEFRLPQQDAQMRRADILRQIAAQQAAARSVSFNYTEYLPYLSGQFTPMYTEPPTFSQPRWAWQLQVTLVVPLYDGGLRYGRARERRSLLEEATLSLDGLLRQARSELRVARESVDRADARVREANASAQLAHQALEISLQRYAEGATTNIEVVDAERESRDADLEAARAEDAARQARLDLLAAAGEFP